MKLLLAVPPLALLLSAAPAPADDPPRPPAPMDVVEAMERAVVDAIDRARPSVVTIDRIKSDDGQTSAVRGRALGVAMPAGGMVLMDGRFAGPESPDFVSYDFGSGVVIGDEGQILTAHHVVVGAARLIVRAPGVPPFDAEILAADPRSDLAVIAPAEGLAASGRSIRLRPIPLGDASTLRPGAFLVALGNAQNVARDGQASAGFGILANTARRLIPPPPDITGVQTRQLQHFSTLFQLDAKLNLGLSGGAVVNLRGELIAVTTASADAVGYDPRAGYAIPMDAIGRRVVDALVEGREVEYGFLGVKLDTSGNRSTNVISDVQPGTFAGEGGLVRDDQIIEVGGRPVSDFDSLTRAVNASPVGEPVTLKVLRQGREVEKQILLSKYPIEGEVIASNRPEPWRGVRVDYASVLGAVNPSIDLLDAMARGGVGVIEVISGSPAEAAGLRPGQVVTMVDGRRVRTPSEFRHAVDEADGKAARLSTDRGTVVVPVEGDEG